MPQVSLFPPTGLHGHEITTAGCPPDLALQQGGMPYRQETPAECLSLDHQVPSASRHSVNPHQLSNLIQ
jgi:hypothetical protein